MGVMLRDEMRRAWVLPQWRQLRASRPNSIMGDGLAIKNLTMLCHGRLVRYIHLLQARRGNDRRGGRYMHAMIIVVMMDPNRMMVRLRV